MTLFDENVSVVPAPARRRSRTTLFGLWSLAVAVVVVSILAPAAVTTIDCGSDVPGAATGEWRPPFQQRYALTSPFGRRFHPIYKEWRLHTGQDLSSLPDAGPVVAAAAGIVISADWDRNYGNIVSLRHGDGVVTRYGHLASIDRDIIPGARIGIGQRVGMEGSTGTSTGLHLHFQVEVNPSLLVFAVGGDQARSLDPDNVPNDEASVPALDVDYIVAKISANYSLLER